jgi:hypothetical protein
LPVSSTGLAYGGDVSVADVGASPDDLDRRRATGSARSLLLTVLGEFVLPATGSASARRTLARRSPAFVTGACSAVAATGDEPAGS